MQPLSSDMSDPNARPYFLWDESTTVGAFRAALAVATDEERDRLIGKLMREARDTDVWRFVRPREVWRRFATIRPHLGRRRAFWEYLFDAWRRDGFLA
ncbi:MAG: hypothetical protein SF182_15870 [Deltaproteobacteria bacterium]|nr:hypothetical protein [Deltaproteobacteria bacterium]